MSAVKTVLEAMLREHASTLLLMGGPNNFFDRNNYLLQKTPCRLVLGILRLKCRKLRNRSSNQICLQIIPALSETCKNI
ncbi:MAG: hypothetical protein ACTS8P_05955 [Arsenophonus sp. NC-XBC3-MAG3]